MPLEALLWQAMTNLMSFVVTQLHQLVQEGGPEGTIVAQHRVKVLRQIAHDLTLHCDELEAVIGGASPDALEKLCDDFTAYLQSVVDDLATPD